MSRIMLTLLLYLPRQYEYYDFVYMINYNRTKFNKQFAQKRCATLTYLHIYNACSRHVQIDWTSPHLQIRWFLFVNLIYCFIVLRNYSLDFHIYLNMTASLITLTMTIFFLFIANVVTMESFLRYYSLRIIILIPILRGKCIQVLKHLIDHRNHNVRFLPFRYNLMWKWK